MKQCYAYIRVSTPRQGEKGVSLQEQRDAILRYAKTHNIEVNEWFEERETAAKSGRPLFTRMLTLLRKKKAQGVIIHKIDRGARNLRDWADINDLSDCGIEVHFANESIDLQSRGGRLSADIQAVVAADFIRNLREETRKGLNGRLKQGIYPFPAPIGYTNCGPGKPKAIDPVQGPLVREAFDLYVTGMWSLRTLVEHLDKKGLRNSTGGKVCVNSLSLVLNNPFYHGLIRLPKTGEVFEGIHEPLVSKSLFDRAQTVLRGKTHRKVRMHAPLFRQLIICASCGRSLYGESQKGTTYYRCHTRTCPMTCFREDYVEQKLISVLLPLELLEEEVKFLDTRLKEVLSLRQVKQKEQRQSLDLKLGQLTIKLRRLTDAFLEGAIERDLFEDRKREILELQAELKERVTASGEQNSITPLRECLELAKSPLLGYGARNPDEKRELIKEAVSNRTASGKILDFSLDFPYQIVANRWSILLGSPEQAKPRMTNNFAGVANLPRNPDGSLPEEIKERIPGVWTDLIARLLDYFADEPPH